MKKPLSIGSQMFFGKILVGCLWLGVGITGMFDVFICQLLKLLCAVAAIAVMILLMRADLEEDDEMSLYNYKEAKAITTDIMHIVICAASILSALTMDILKDADVCWQRIVPGLFFVLLGVQNIITGLVFRKLEAE